MEVVLPQRSHAPLDETLTDLMYTVSQDSRCFMLTLLSISEWFSQRTTFHQLKVPLKIHQRSQFLIGH